MTENGWKSKTGESIPFNTGYLQFGENPPRTRDEAIERLREMGYDLYNKMPVAGAILDDTVEEVFKGIQHIVLVDENDIVGHAYQIYPLLQERDKNDFVLNTFAGGHYADAEFMLMFNDS